MTFVLRDGRRVAVRPIQPSDRVHLELGLERLGERTRRMRFHGERTAFTSDELDYLTRCDGVDRIAEVAIGLDSSDEEEIGVAVARAYRDAEDSERAEVAVVVIDEWQGIGVGRLLLGVLAEKCWKVGIRQWTASVLGENTEMVRLLESFGSILSRAWCGGVQELIIELREPSF
ncbi:GNAT family N-acetyltransferase [bacterium]|nr:MAG: GNAT family N-acetyltransferase [bacterium]